MDAYDEYLARKVILSPLAGFNINVDELNKHLFPFQKDMVKWMLRGGRRLNACQCGCGKTPMQLEICHQISKRYGPTIILAPLAVTHQTVREGNKFNIPVEYLRSPGNKKPDITVINYEMMDRFNLSEYVCVEGDEIGIIKNYSGKIRNKIIDGTCKTRFRFGFTATPSPNDFEEIGNHSEYLGIMRRVDMLQRFFTHKGETTQDWTLKGHAESAYWEWLATWMIMCNDPADYGYEQAGFKLPELRVHKHILDSVNYRPDMLIAMPAQTLEDQRACKRYSLKDRVNMAVKIATSEDSPCIIWCELNKESEMLAKAIPSAVEVSGTMDLDEKEKRLAQFSLGEKKTIITKLKIGGLGLNWQHCHRQIFVNLTHSYEGYYQGVRRSWRFGQQSPVDVHIILSDAEGPILTNMQRKEALNNKMQEGIKREMQKTWQRK